MTAAGLMETNGACAFLGEGDERVVLTMWSAMEDIEALERSPRYRETVAAIADTGFILHAEPAITGELES